MTYRYILKLLKKKWGKLRPCYNKHLKGIALGCAECQFHIAYSILQEFAMAEEWSVARKKDGGKSGMMKKV